MNLIWLLLIVLLVLALVGAPATGIHSYGWGPSGVLGVVIVIVLVMLLTGRL